MALLNRDGYATARERSRGQVLAEFTLAIPLFMLIVLAIAEGSYFVAASNIVSSATHEGARLGVLETTNSRDTIRNRVQSSAAAIVSLDTSDVTLQIASVKEDGSHEAVKSCDNTCYQARKKDDRLIVRTDYTHTPLVGYVFGGVSFEVPARAELTVEGDAV